MLHTLPPTVLRRRFPRARLSSSLLCLERRTPFLRPTPLVRAPSKSRRRTMLHTACTDPPKSGPRLS